MSKHILFLIHGVGYDEKDTWAAGLSAKLKDVSLQYGWFQKNNFDDVIEIVPITYDDIFRQILAEWKTNIDEQVKYIKDNNILSDTGYLDKIKSYVDKSDDKDNFVWANVTDVLIYRSLNMKGYRDRIRMHVIAQLSEKIGKSLKNPNVYNGCSIVAHSLGTHVLHDCVNLLGKTVWSDFGNAFAPDRWRFTNIFMLANTAFLLEDDYPAYSSIARPGAAGDMNSYCYYYYNVKHELDPVCFRKTFQATDWPSKIYSNIPVNHFRKGFVHDFDHYLDNPAVHIPILRGATHPWAVTNEEEERAIKNYPQFIPEVPISQDELNALTVLKETMGQTPTNSTLLPSIIQIFEAIEKFTVKEVKTHL